MPHANNNLVVHSASSEASADSISGASPKTRSTDVHTCCTIVVRIDRGSSIMTASGHWGGHGVFLGDE